MSGMSPAELDIVMNGAFIYESNGRRFASLNYKLGQMAGITLVRRSGALTAEDLAQPASVMIDRLNAELAA